MPDDVSLALCTGTSTVTSSNQGAALFYSKVSLSMALDPQFRLHKKESNIKRSNREDIPHDLHSIKETWKEDRENTYTQEAKLKDIVHTKGSEE